jgi:2'-5' RNA ligase
LTVEIREALAKVQDHLREHIPRARWTRPEGTHLTLKFLGEVEQVITVQVAAILDDIATRHTPFQVKLQGTGAFPRLAQPRVLWVGLERHPSLSSLQAEIEEALVPLSFEKEQRPFRGHLTLARLKGDRWPEELRQILLDTGSRCEGLTLPVKQLYLYQSELKPGGAVYTQLHTSQMPGG